MDTKEMISLKECLEKRSPILYLGAGFTFKSKNKNGYSIPLAEGLCRNLYEYFWGEDVNGKKHFKTIEAYRGFAEEKTRNSDLKQLSQLLRQKALLDERNIHFTNLFTGCNIAPEDSRNAICNYPWSKIFTVNIDDLVENIYAANLKELNVWNRDNDDKKHSSKYPTLIKLHGCINNPEQGYVFDDEEYTKFLTDEDYILNEFGDAFSKNDIIFVGTEFQENDLKHIMQKYSNMGYDASSVNHYYFIAPSINDVLTKDEIDNSPNMHHIPMTAEKFFEFIKTEIILVDETYNKLKEYGLINVYDIYQNLTSSYASELYYGKDINYTDLRDNWDITQQYSEIIEWAKNDSNNKIIALYGRDYVGKTCIAKRLLYDFFISLDYDCYEFKLDSTDKIELFLNHIEKCDKKIAVLYEGASYLYELLVRRIVEDNPHKHSIIVITTDISSNHNRKHHSLLKNPYCKTLIVSEKINSERANLIYDKLEEKHSLSRLTDDYDSKDKVIKFMIESNDIIDVLYHSSLGRGFEEHIDLHILSDLNESELIKKQISIFCTLKELGITFIPKILFKRVTSVIMRDFQYNAFESKFKKILQIEKGYYHLRYLRFLSTRYSKVLSHEEVIAVIKVVIKYVAGRFNEGEYNEYSSILYKTLNLKSLSLILPYSEIKKIYLEIERDCKQYSYYWVQRGMCAQKQQHPDYEEADRFLREAKRIRPASYQVAHAVAKNLIERGLNSNNARYFEDGIEQLKSLLENKQYSRAFSYSLHAYVDSWLRYSECSKELISDEVCNIIDSYVEEMTESDIDSRLSDIMFRLKKYAKKNKCHNLKNVTQRYWYISNNEAEDEIIENDWII